jgi:hypothetical protein
MSARPFGGCDCRQGRDECNCGLMRSPRPIAIFDVERESWFKWLAIVAFLVGMFVPPLIDWFRGWL